MNPPIVIEGFSLMASADPAQVSHEISLSRPSLHWGTSAERPRSLCSGGRVFLSPFVSLRLLTLVWDRAPYEGGELLVLLALADFSNDEGVSWPSLETVGAKARITRRHARRTIRKLESDGVISVEQRGALHRSNNYIISLEKLRSFPDRSASAAPVEAPAKEDAHVPLPKRTRGTSKTARRTFEASKGDTHVPPTVRTVKEPSDGEESETKGELKIEALRFVTWFEALVEETGGSILLTQPMRDNWAACYERMIRIDKRTKKEVAEVCRWARLDPFWKRNFLSPMKLRDRNDGGVMYYDVFLSKLRTPDPDHANNKKSTSRSLTDNSNVSGFAEYDRRLAAGEV